jgi:hypothetical protein
MFRWSGSRTCEKLLSAIYSRATDFLSMITFAR